jgi:phospholipase/carboxylesterase
MREPAEARQDLGFIHRFVRGSDPSLPPLLLLHGTGGDENDLIALGEELLPGAALLSPRGKVLKNGMPRFFRRLAEGVFDLEDLKQRAAELADFVDGARAAYGLGAPIALGYSNGANVAAAMMLLRPESLSGAILMRAVAPFETAPTGSALPGTPVLILSGGGDPIVPHHHREALVRLLTDAGASVEHKVLPAGHQLTQRDLQFAGEWLRAVVARS